MKSKAAAFVMSSGKAAEVFPSLNFDTAVPAAIRDLWPSIAQGSILRNDNNPASVYEVKAAGFCARRVNNVWYFFAEVIKAAGALTNVVRMSSSVPYGPYEFDPLVPTYIWNTAQFVGSNNEASMTTIMDNPWGPGVIAFLHGGNNIAPRKIYYATSLDSTGSPATWTAGNGGNPIILPANPYDINRAADAFAIYDPISDLILIFYRGEDAGGSTAVCLATMNSAGVITKLGVVIPTADFAAANGPVPGGIFENQAGRYHIWLSGNDPAAGVKYGFSDNKGATWTVTASPILTPNGIVTTEDGISVGDGIAPIFDNRYPEVAFLAVGSSNVGGSYPNNSPIRAKLMWLIPWPRPLASIVEPAKFYGNDFAATRAETTFSPAISILNSSQFMLAMRVRFIPLAADTTESGPPDLRTYRHVVTASTGIFNIIFYARLEAGGGVDAGTFHVFFRTPIVDAQLSSPTRLDDGVEHDISVERSQSGGNLFSLRVDGNVVDTTAVDPGVNATAAFHALGNFATGGGEASQPSRCAIRRVVYITGEPPGTAQSVQEALDSGTVYGGGTLQMDSETSGVESGPVATVEWQRS